MSTVVVRSHFDVYTGFGQFACGLVEGLLDRGYDVISLGHYWANGFPYGKISPRVCETYREKDPGFPSELVFHLPERYFGPKKFRVHFTMWESTRLKREWVQKLNRASAVVLPSDFNIECFSACGVDSPMYKIPLSIEAGYGYKKMPKGKEFIFGCGGRSAHGKIRKGMGRVVESFLKAFPHEKNVRLRVKVSHDCDLNFPKDYRVQVYPEYLQTTKMAAWYHGLNCFVSAATAEGWGLMQHQAMMCGRPVISAKFGGVAEFIDEAHSFVVSHKLVPAEENQAGLGVWAGLEEWSLIEQMRRAYGNWDMVEEKGWKSHLRVQEFSRERMVGELIPILERYKIPI